MLYQITKKPSYELEQDVSHKKISETRVLFIILQQQSQAGPYRGLGIKLNTVSFCFQLTHTEMLRHRVSVGSLVLFKAKRLLEHTSPLGRERHPFSANKVTIGNDRRRPAALARL